MGKGDKRSRRGKIWKGSYGVSRKRKKKNKPAFVPKAKITVPPKITETIAENVAVEAEQVKSKPKRAPAKKAAVKKKAEPKKKEQ